MLTQHFIQHPTAVWYRRGKRGGNNDRERVGKTERGGEEKVRVRDKVRERQSERETK